MRQVSKTTSLIKTTAALLTIGLLLVLLSADFCWIVTPTLATDGQVVESDATEKIEQVVEDETYTIRQLNLSEIDAKRVSKGAKYISKKLVKIALEQDGEIERLVGNFSPKTQNISTFSTSFATSSAGRIHNITLATGNFSWLVVKAGERLSFNTIVGARTEERGYANAKVILWGEYVDGVGGGVCQVSTTLYNAWIRAGLGTEQVVNHSLPSSYCELSQDATVSEYTDMILLNDSGYDVVVNGKVVDKTVTFRIYGAPTEYTYKIESKLLEVLPPTAPEVVYSATLEGMGEIREDGEGQYVVLRQEKNGYRSQAVRKKYKDGVEVESKLLRVDTYKPSRGKICVKRP
ncbi:MAG: VanW family protein [Christensenellales bacterium]